MAARSADGGASGVTSRPLHPRLRRQSPSPSLRDREDRILHRHPGLDPGSMTAALHWIPDQVRDDEGLQTTGSGPSDFRHPELVSGSMACRFLRRSARRELRPWMLKQVQHDEVSRQLPPQSGPRHSAARLNPPRRPGAHEILERGEQHRARVAAQHLAGQAVEAHAVAATGCGYDVSERSATVSATPANERG